jgi:hypothetical protein
MAASNPPASRPAQPAGAPPAGSARAAGPADSSPAKVTAETAPYVTRPTRTTLFLRTFLPWQLWRFARINLKMIRIIHRSRT